MIHFFLTINDIHALSVTEVNVRQDEFDYLCKYLGMNNHMSRLLDNQGELMDTIITK